MLREITDREAFDRYIQGEEVNILMPKRPNASWDEYEPITLSVILDGVRYLVETEDKTDEPDADQDDDEEAPEAAAPETEEDPGQKEEAEEIEEPAQKKKGRPSRLNLDEGKISALHKAGWSNVKIAEEMGTSDVTIAKRLKDMKARGEI